MSTVKQVGLLPAGCQPWNTDVCAASGDRFAYCATLAIYIYQLDRQSNEFKLHSIMSEHKKTITAISWHPRNPDVIASGSADNQIIIWNIAEQQVMAKLNKIRHAPCSIGWCFHEKDSVGFVYLRGPLFLWNFTAGSGVAIHKDAQNFSSDVCQFRWHHKKMGKMVFGHTNGSLSFFFPDRRSQRHVLRPEELEDSNEDDPIAALEWDPLSVEYLLVANTHQGVRLIDSEAVSVIMKFQLPSAAAEVHTLAWINSAPGMFLTGDTQSGVMRLWNVSKSTPIENIRLKKTGFHAMSVFSTVPSIATNNNAGEQESAHVSSTSLAMGPSVSSSRYALPPGHAVCTFLDGGVGLYDLGKRKWNFLRDLGHIETIFDCKFKPDNPDLLATGSFDGTIKIWNVNTMTAIHTSPGNEGVIYCLSWAPADLNCVAGCTSRQGAFIWDITKGKVIKRFSEHGKSAVYSVAWNRKDSRRIATCGADGYCIVRQVDGQLIQKYKHPAPVFGCDWSTNNKDMIATGCEDKCVRVFYLATTSDQPLKVFTGHTAKVFQVKWSPLREGILCSGSDDGTIRIWDYTQDSCQSTLVGHSAPVRGLLWSSEIPYLLISGSWDYSIRIWDTRDGACIDTVLDHGADVYGLTCHPERPFTLASCSRDSTVRIWSLTPLVQPLEMNIIASRPWTDIVATPEYAMSHGTPPLLSGKVSKDLKMQIDKIQTNTYTRTLRWFSKLFAGPGGADNLWELVNVINGIDDSLLSPKYGTGIMHIKHITRFKGASAQELEMAKLAKKTIGIGSVNKEDQLRQAADIHIKMGNIQRYCELMVELGEWDKALSVSPGVSVDYWKSLCDRRAQFLMKEENDDCIPFSIASGDSQKVIRYMTSRGQLQDAMLVATSAYEGNIAPPRSSRSKNKNQVNGLDETADNYSVQLHTTSRELANWYFHNGSPILAACCHLAVDDCEGAMAKLIRGNELELAVSVGTVLQKVKDLLHLAVELLARRCEKIGRWDLAVDLLKTIPEPEEALIKLCARCNGSMIEINDLHAKAGLPSMDECQQRAESLKSNSDPMECIEFYLLSPVPETGLEIGLEYIKRVMTSSKWQADDIFPYLSLLGCIKTEKLQQHKCAKMRSELLALCAYVGGLVAIRRQYNTIVQALFKHAMQCMQRDGAEIPISLSLMSAELEAWRTHQYITGKIPGSPTRKEHTMSKEMKPTLDELFVKAGEEASDLGVGCDYVTGAHLPCHSDVHESFFTGQRIQGPAYFLEDGRSAVSINDAMMWAKVNPFSPLGSGMRINPF